MAEETKVSDKFSTSDIFRYFMPGMYIVFLTVAILWMNGTDIPEHLSEGVFGSVVFLVASFLLGILLQTVASWWPEDILKAIYWNGRFPVETILDPSDKLLSDYKKSEILAMLIKSGLIDGHFSSLPDKQRRERTEYIHRQLTLSLPKEKLSEYYLADSYYQLYRGCYTASAIGVIYSIYLLYNHSLDGLFKMTFAGVSLLTLILFFTKSKKLAEKAAKEPFYALHSKAISAHISAI